MRFCRRPPPHPRLRRSSPAPAVGAGSVRGDIRGAAVSGVEPAGNRIRLFPTYPLALDRVDIATGGEADGEGEQVPPPLSPTLQPSYFSPAPPPPGAGSVLAISGEQPYPVFLQDLPMCWTVGISPLGVGLTGRGNSFPLPCLPHFNHLTSRRHPHPARACGAPPPPPPRGRGQCLRYQGNSRIRGGAGGQPYPALLQDLPMLWTVWISPRGEAARGYLTSRRPRLRRSAPTAGWPGAVPGCCRRGAVLKRDMAPATGRGSSPDPS